MSTLQVCHQIIRFWLQVYLYLENLRAKLYRTQVQVGCVALALQVAKWGPHRNFRTNKKFFDATYRTKYVAVALTFFTAAEIVYYHETMLKFLNRRI